MDPTQGDQNVRGTCVLPCGTGKEVKVCVFADKEFHESLAEMGCDVIGDEKLLRDISEGAALNFDKIISTPEHMQGLKTLARVLGPKGLMPNVKSGTLVKPDDLMETVKQAKQGLIEFRVNENGTIMGKFGKRDFPDDNLKTNVDAFIRAVARKRPESVKGKYLSNAMVKTSMGPTIKLDIQMYQLLGGSNQQ